LPFLAWAALLLSLVCWHIALQKDDGRSYFFNSDMLTIEALYRDVIAGLDLYGWRLSGAPSFFPDMVQYFLLRTLVPSVPWTVLIYGLVSFAIMLSGWLALWRCFPAGRLGREHAPVVLAAAASAAAAAWGLVDYSSRFLLANTSHAGPLVMLPWSFFLTLQLGRPSSELSPGKRMACAVTLCILVVLGVASDKLFLAQVTVPVMAVVAWRVFAGRASWPVATGFIALLGGCVAGGLLVFRLLSRYPVVANYEKWGFPIDADVWACHGAWILRMWSRHPVHAMAVTAFLALAAWVFVRACRKPRSMRGGADAEPAEAFAIFYIAGFAANAGMLLFAGNTDGVAISRYAMAFLFIPAWWGWPFLVQAFAPARAWLAGDVAAKRLCIASLALMAACLPILSDAPVLKQCADYYPRYLRRLDKELARRDLHDGIADYWMAKHLSCLSHRDLRLAQVVFTFQPYFWVNNWASYRIRPQFAIVDLEWHNPDHRVNERLIVERYGAPADYFVCDRLLVLVYNRPTDRAFQSMFASYDDTPK